MEPTNEFKVYISKQRKDPEIEMIQEIRTLLKKFQEPTTSESEKIDLLKRINLLTQQLTSKQFK
ncbi:hypothetical protein RZN22_07055 [Bacillaceae bacterium S4-13-58]